MAADDGAAEAVAGAGDAAAVVVNGAAVVVGVAAVESKTVTVRPVPVKFGVLFMYLINNFLIYFCLI